MKKLFTIVLLAFLAVEASAQQDPNMGIIPAPVSVKKNSGTFKLDKTVVLISNEPKN
jgi:hexosaminidase